MQASVGLNLTSPTVVAGRSPFAALNATPGGLVAFALGTQLGSGTIKIKGQELALGIAKPKVVAQAIGDASGQALVIVDLFQYAGQTVYLQAFEHNPLREVTHVMTITVPPLPELSIDDVMVDEDAGQAVFTVTLSAASDREIRVKYATANGTARSRSDSTRKRGTLKIPAGELSGQIIVPIKNDAKPEDQEVFHVKLSRAKNATLAENRATGTISDDEGLALRLAARPGRRNAAGTLTAEQLAAVTDEAIRRWASAVGDQAAAGLSGVNWELADLPGDLLGLAEDGTVWIDRDAAGRGWFADASPWDDAEFLPVLGGEELRARRGSPAAGRADLLTAVMHELGHVLGLPDVSAGGDVEALMSDSLRLGQRRLP